MSSTVVFRVLGVAIVVSAFSGASAFGLPFEVPVDPTQSTLTFELCLAGECGSDSSSVTGMFIIELDSVDFPAQITLYDFQGELAETLNVHLDFGWIGGDLYATLTDGAVLYANPGTPFGPVPVDGGGAFLFAGTPTNAEGALAYEATPSYGIACLALQAAGLPCSDTRYLQDEGAQEADLDGFVSSVDRTVTLSSDVDVTVPIDEENPDLGTLRVTGTLRGQTYVPQPPGDVDRDGDVDLIDFAHFAECLAGPEVTTPPPGCSQYHFDNAGLDADADVDLADFTMFAEVFAGG